MLNFTFINWPTLYLDFFFFLFITCFCPLLSVLYIYMDAMLKLTPSSPQITTFLNQRLCQIAVEKGQIFVLFAYKQ